LASSLAFSDGHPGVLNNSFNPFLVSSGNRNNSACNSSLSVVRCERGTAPAMDERSDSRIDREWGRSVVRKMVDDSEAIFVCWTVAIWRWKGGRVSE
jgi:hypothetical protein